MRHLLAIFALLLPLLMSGGHGTERVYHQAPVQLCDSVITLPSVAAPGGKFRVEARVALCDLREQEVFSRGSWSLSLNPTEGIDTLRVSLRWGNTAYGDILDRRFTLMTISLGDSVISSEEVKGFVGTSGTYSTLAVAVGDGVGEVSGGSRGVNPIGSFRLPEGFVPSSSSVTVAGAGTVSLLVSETEPQMEAALSTGWDESTLDSQLASSSDPVEGYWDYLDRENDPHLARLGGRYRLALVRNGSGGYDIIYISGAQTHASRWKPFMRKGRLTPTIFKDHYTLEWIDAEFDETVRDIHGDVTEGAILTLSFPLLKTQLRFSKARF
ncbi:MAG: hypothetical protein NC039_01615 [Muribaculaceae bacterium]|nr:hypothetical protein [Muribaculaceae bacterium]